MNEQLKSLKLKDLKELSLKNKEATKDFNLVFKGKQEARILEIKESKDINFEVKQESNAEIIIIIKKDADIKIKTDVGRNASFKIMILTNKDVLIRQEAECQENSFIEFVTFSTSNIDCKTSIKLKQNARGELTNSYFSEEKESRIRNEATHLERSSKSKIKTNAYLIDSNTNTSGLIKIKSQANDSEGFQESKTLMEGNSKTTSIPDLEIKNNEVKCSHGSTVTRIKDEDLFYFESRGITRKEAREMMIQSHLLSIIPQEKKEICKDFLERGET